MNDNQQQGAKGCEMLIGLYDEMIRNTSGNIAALRKIYAMALESEMLDRWPVEQKERLIGMFEEAIQLAEIDATAAEMGETLH